MNTLSEIEVLSLICNKLEQAKISYMLTGSFASNFYSTPRMTRDIDIVIELNKPGVERLYQALQQDFYMSQEAAQEAVDHQTMFNVIHNDSVYKIDFIIRKNAEYRKTEFLRKQQVKVNDAPIWIISPEDLIISKLFWAKDTSSEMQIKDIQNLLRSVKNLDKEYLDIWIQKLHLGSIYEKVHQNE